MNPNDFILKSITLSIEKFSDFLTMSNEDAGEFIKYLLQYAMDGTRPKMSNVWKQNMYSIYERTITEQMSALDTKRKKASVQAQAREKEKKEAFKLLKSEKAKGKVTSSKDTSSEVTVVEVNPANDRASEAKSVEVSSTEVEVNTGSSPEITSEDLTFAHFVSILGKRDSNPRYNSDAEALWLTFSDDKKRKALNWVQDYVGKTLNMSSRQFPHALLTSHPWDNFGA